jgi:TRAP transporter TAXI family solute receptor
MRKTMIVLLAVGAFIISSAAGAGAEWKSDKKFLKMFSGPEGGSWYPLGSGIMSLVEANIKGVSTSNGPGGGVGNLKSVQRGEADLGWSYSHTVYDGYNGRAPFKDKLNKVRYLASLYPGIFQVAVPRKSDIYSYSDMADKRICPGKVGFSGEVFANSILGAYGITYGSIKKKGGVVHYVGYSDAAALMKDGHLDVYMAVTSCPQSTIIDLNFRPGIRIIGIDEEHMKKILNDYPGYAEVVVPKTAYTGMTEDVSTVGTVTSLVCSADLSGEMVYRIVKTIFENLDELAKIKKDAIADVSLENALLGCKIPVHPGAKRYYDEHGVKVK